MNSQLSAVLALAAGSVLAAQPSEERRARRGVPPYFGQGPVWPMAFPVVAAFLGVLRDVWASGVTQTPTLPPR